MVENAPSLVKFGNFAFVSSGSYSPWLLLLIMCYFGIMWPCLPWHERNRWCLCESFVICRVVKLKLARSCLVLDIIANGNFTFQ
ncbi:hypothetical protein CR513_58325, partial [Mucuna pruriens]